MSETAETVGRWPATRDEGIGTSLRHGVRTNGSDGTVRTGTFDKIHYVSSGMRLGLVASSEVAGQG